MRSSSSDQVEYGEQEYGNQEEQREEHVVIDLARAQAHHLAVDAAQHLYPPGREKRVDAVLVLRESSGKVDHQVVADASNPNNAQIYASYLEGVMSRNVPDPALTTTLYNPQLKSSYNFVPGIMGMIFILICAMMTSVSSSGRRRAEP